MLTSLTHYALRMSSRLWLRSEHGGVVDFEGFALAQVHVDAAGETGVEAADGAHNVDAFEVLGAVLFEDGGVLDRIFVGAGGAVDVAGVGVPGRGWVGVVVGDLAVADDDVVGEDASDGLVEAAAYGLIGDGELGVDLGAAGM